MQRLDQGLLPACVITCLGVTLEYGDFNALRARHPDAKQMGDDAGSKMLYSKMGAEPKRRTASYPYPVPSHD
jgi:Fe-S-cluster-containing dehydrogenase component